MHLPSRRSPLAALAVAIVAASSLAVASAAPASAQATMLRVSLSDSGMRVHGTVRAGLTEFAVARPRGEKTPTAHAIVVQRLTQVISFEDFMRSVKAGSVAQLGLPYIGGPILPADTLPPASTTADLRSGRYVIYCVERHADGALHAVRDDEAAMINVVLPFGFGERAPPPPDAAVTLRENGVAAPETLRPGRRVFSIENRSSGVRRAIVGRLREGKKLSDVAAWDRTRRGEAPFEHVLSVSALSPKRTVFVVRTLVPGNYFVASLGARYGKGELAGASLRPLEVPAPATRAAR